MTSGKLTKKPSDFFRDKLNTRTRKTLIDSGSKIGHLTDAQKKTPSQRKSELLKKKLSRGVESIKALGYDCNGCLKYPCGKTTETCEEPTRKNRCAKCGGLVVYRYVEGKEWKYCEVCRGEGRC